jgi:hypothetical protein
MNLRILPSACKYPHVLIEITVDFWDEVFSKYRTRTIISRDLYFFTQFSLWLRLILQTIYVLKTEILHLLSSKSAAYKQERIQIESGLWWRAYGICANAPSSIAKLKIVLA